MPAPALAQSIKGNSRDYLNVSPDLHAKEAVDIAQGLEENVFLFVPNLIGQLTSTKVIYPLTYDRIYKNYTGSNRLILYASEPMGVHSAIWMQLSPRRGGRLCRSSTRTDFQIRSSPRHDNR